MKGKHHKGLARLVQKELLLHCIKLQDTNKRWYALHLRSLRLCGRELLVPGIAVPSRQSCWCWDSCVLRSTPTTTAAGPGHLLTAGLKVHPLPGGLYTLRHARPNYPLARLTYEERARARAAGKTADLEALMELKGQVVADAEGLLSSWQDGRDPCTFERVGEGLAPLPPA